MHWQRHAKAAAALSFPAAHSRPSLLLVLVFVGSHWAGWEKQISQRFTPKVKSCSIFGHLNSLNQFVPEPVQPLGWDGRITAALTKDDWPQWVRTRRQLLSCTCLAGICFVAGSHFKKIQECLTQGTSSRVSPVETEPILQWKAANYLWQWSMYTLGAGAFNNIVIQCCCFETSKYNQNGSSQETAENIAATGLSVESWFESPQVWKNTKVSNADHEQLVLTWWSPENLLGAHTHGFSCDETPPPSSPSACHLWRRLWVGRLHWPGSSHSLCSGGAVSSLKRKERSWKITRTKPMC